MSDEVVDPLPAAREECEHHCTKLKERLDECNNRVSSRTKTDENCHEEFIDFISCVDHCAMPKAFAKLK
uniref:Cytochrome b-c1 complex subunit 6 n=1 Tax=Plectus sambesii TaxID=2011161 RepID=A0A914UPW4_9BILA